MPALEATVAGKERKVDEASKVFVDTGRALKLARTRVEAEAGIEQWIKEASRRLTLNQEKSPWPPWRRGLPWSGRATPTRPEKAE